MDTVLWWLVFSCSSELDPSFPSSLKPLPEEPQQDRTFPKGWGGTTCVLSHHRHSGAWTRMALV